MKTLRKSLNGSKDTPRLQISTPLPLPTVSRPPLAIRPPQKVIRALASNRSQAPQELSFQKGDFFYVISDNEDHGPWYEAHNPVTGARGLVPRQMFEEFKRTASSRASQSDSAVPQTTNPARSPNTKHQVYYAIVQHDFDAERPDELDAKRGDTITVVAQSNREWFVAKPIGRLGRPGLIPVSFVEIHDPVTGTVITDVDGLIDRGELPKVEDWKKAMLTYKQNSISLGVIDTPLKSPGLNSPYPYPSTPSMSNPVGNHPFSYHEPVQPVAPEPLSEGLLLSADVVSFHYEMNEYWFRIDALYQPYQKPGESRLPPAKQLILFRVYNDFYEFQVSLLDAFPREGGRHPPHPRILPFMPGPAENVDDALTATRRAELDVYIHGLCDLSHAGYRYILEHPIVREFLSLKPGDVDNDVDPRTEDIQTILDNELKLQQEDNLMNNNYEQEMDDRLSKLRVEDDRNDGSEYLDNRYNPSSMSQPFNGDRQSYAEVEPSLSNDDFRSLQPPYGQAHQRTSSSSSFHSRTQSPFPDHHSTQPLRNGGHSQAHVRQESGCYQNGGASTTSLRSSSQNASQSRPPSAAAKNLNTPPISAANPQTAFVKIKIFTRGAEDLIAIRVHPKVTHSELMDKVQGRLGEEVMMLRYRDSVTDAFVGLESDSELRAWLERTDKHVLYAA